MRSFFWNTHRQPVVCFTSYCGLAGIYFICKAIQRHTDFAIFHSKDNAMKKPNKFPVTNTSLVYDEMPCFARSLRTGDIGIANVTLVEDCIKQMLPDLGDYMAKHIPGIHSWRLVDSAKEKMTMPLDRIITEILSNGPSEKEKADGFRNGVIMHLTATGPESGSLVIKHVFCKITDEESTTKIITKKIYESQKDEGKTA